MYCEVSISVKGRRWQRSAMRCLSWRVLGLFEFGIELGLAGENDLQHLAAAGFEIAKKPDLFEHIPIEILRFIHDQNRGLMLVGALDQHGVEREQDFGFRSARAAKVEIVCHHLEELIGREARIEDKRKWRVMGGKVVAQAFEHGGLAGSDFSGQDDETLSALHPVNREAGKRFFVLYAPVEKRRVRAQVERRTV